MIVWLLVIVLSIVYISLVCCLVHKTKENNILIDNTCRNIVISAILFKFVSNINEQVSEDIVHACMLNAIKRCLNNGTISINNTDKSETEICETVARDINQIIIENEREDN